MSRAKDNAAEQAEQQQRKSVNWSGMLPALVFILILGVAGVLYWQQQQEQRALASEKREKIEELGLPDEYPLELVPLYPGVEILHTERGKAESTDGEPMDKWVVEGQVDVHKDTIFDFYKEHLIAQGMSQTQVITVPSGHGVDYGDEFGTVHLEIEKLSRDKLTQLRITIHRLEQ